MGGPYVTDNTVSFFEPQYLVTVQRLFVLALCAVLRAVISVAVLGNGAVLGDVTILCGAAVFGIVVLGVAVLGEVLYLGCSCTWCVCTW